VRLCFLLGFDAAAASSAASPSFVTCATVTAGGEGARAWTTGIGSVRLTLVRDLRFAFGDGSSVGLTN